MYCPSCGTEYSIELKYCNRCGANLSTDVAMQPQFVPVSLTKPAIVIGAILTLLTLGGFGVLTSAAVELSRAARLAPEGITGIVITGMLIILIADIFLVRLLTKIINASLSSNLQAPPRRPQALSNPSAVYLPQPATARLQGVPSVTEGTTRFFEAYRVPAEGAERTPAQKLDS
jgi:hypothetical protein